MKHYPASRAPAHLVGLSDQLTQSPCKPRARLLPVSTTTLIHVIVFVAGFFIGALAFGSALVRQHEGAAPVPLASSLTPNASRQ